MSSYYDDPDFTKYEDDRLEAAAQLREREESDTYEPCGCLSNTANAHRASCPEYLGEVPWSDRVDD